MRSVYEELLEYCQTIPVVDTHEHLPPYERSRDQEADILRDYLQHYFSCDLISAGLSHEALSAACDVKQPLMKRWERIEPYWESARLTGYGRALDKTVQLLYGIPGIRRDTLESANDAFRKALTGGGQYRRVLKDLGHIRTSLLDMGTLDCDREFFTPVFSAHNWIRPESTDEMVRMAKKQGIRLHSLADYEQAFRLAFKDAKENGARALKSGLAYSRSLYYRRPSRSDAERAFAEALDFNHALSWSDRPRPSEVFEDHMMHYTCNLAAELNLPFQIHTGLQEGNGNLLSSSDPMLLTNLFYEYPDTKFDIFHIGYPWHIQLSALAKNFRNVYIDMCWAHIISPNAARAALNEYLDAVPANKIMAFGGDYCFIDAVIAHLEMARENVARVLADKIELGGLDMDGAKRLAKMLFFDNPMALFKL